MSTTSSQRLREAYDFVVLGENEGSLLSACLAARLGLSVLVVPLIAVGKTVRSASGQVLDPETNALYGITGTEADKKLWGGLLGRCFEHLGIMPEEWSQLEVPAGNPQVVTPERRIFLSQTDQEFRNELEREFGAESVRRAGLLPAAARIEKIAGNFWTTFPDYLSFDEKEKSAKRPVAPLPRSLNGDIGDLLKLFRKTAEKQLEKTAEPQERVWLSESSRLDSIAQALADPSWAEVGAGIWNSVSGQEKETPSADEMLQALLLARSAARTKGGMTAYRLLLSAIARRLGAHVLGPKNECRRIFIENGKFVGVQASNIPSMIGARGGAIEMPLARVRERIEFSGKHRNHELKPGLPISGWRFTVAMTISAHGVPPGAGARLTWQERGAPAVEYEFSDPIEYSVSEPQQRLLFMRTTLPFDKSTLDRGFLRMTAGRMVRLGTELFPFLEQHMIKVFPDFRAVTGDFDALYGFQSLEEIPYNWLRFSSAGLGSRSGVDAMALVSPESFPRLGQFGTTVAAVEAAAWLAQASGIPGPMMIQASPT